MKSPYLKHLKSSKDLETPYEAIRAGFVMLALEKNRRATPFVEQARALKTAASRVKRPRDLLTLQEIQPALLTAAGVSDKAADYLQDSDKKEAILGLITGFLEPDGVNFVEELVFRFLLTRGDTLGGSMRNAGGVLAQRIHEAFARNQLKPHTFFIGAAIEPRMAAEIWNFLESGILENAANLTDDDQIASVTSWLCSL